MDNELITITKQVIIDNDEIINYRQRYLDRERRKKQIKYGTIAGLGAGGLAIRHYTRYDPIGRKAKEQFYRSYDKVSRRVGSALADAGPKIGEAAHMRGMQIGTAADRFGDQVQDLGFKEAFGGVKDRTIDRIEEQKIRGKIKVKNYLSRAAKLITRRRM